MPKVRPDRCLPILRPTGFFAARQMVRNNQPGRFGRLVTKVVTEVVRIPLAGPAENLDKRIEDECEARLGAGQALAACFFTPASIVLIFQSDPPSIATDDSN